MNPRTKYYRLNNLYLSIDLPVLVDDSGLETDLEPKVWRLVILFCQHHQKIITRDEIIEHVYNGTIVSDNAVNKMVAKARRLLGDVPSNPRFIKTIPKQGYCLIADIEEINTIDPRKDIKGTKLNKYSLYSLTALVLFIACYFLFSLDKKQNDHFINKKLSPLTRSVGVEFAPHLSPDNQYLVYQKNSPQNALHGWWLKRLDNHVQDRSLAIENSFSPIAWSKQKSSFLYVEHQEQCTVHKMSIEVESETTTQVMNCGDNWIAHLLYSGDELGFYYVSRKEYHDPWEVYFYSFEEKKSVAINQPQASGLGNYAIDLSPKKDKLLILSSNSDDTTTLYELKLESNELTQKGKRDWPLYKAIWHHDNERIVHTSQRYARELLVTNLSGDSESTLVSTSKRVSDDVMRHPNNIDFYFTSFQMNNDLISYIDGVENTMIFDNSEVYEKLPVYSNSFNTWYFVSNRLGISQIFLSSATSSMTKQISNFEIEHEFISLDASVSGKLLAYHDAKYLTILDSDTGKYTNYETPFGKILSSNWLGNEKVSLSILKGTNILSYVFNINKKTFLATSPRWQAVFSGQDTNRIFAVAARTNKLFEVDDNYHPIAPLQIELESIIDYAGLQIKATNGALVYAKTQGLYTELISYSLEKHSVKNIGKWLYVAGFDVFGENLILSFEKSRTGDVMRSHLQITN